MKTIGWIVVFLLVIIAISQCGHPTAKFGWKKPGSDIRSGFATSEANQDTMKTGIRDLQGRPQRIYNGGGKTIIRETIVREIPASRQSTEPVYYPAPQQSQQVLQPPQQQVGPRSSEITPGNIAGPDQFKFCIDLEMEKRNDDEKKFLFWELVNNRGYSIPNIVTNGKGPANMILRPGESVDGISYDGSILRISKSSMGRWYSEIFGIPMPTSFRPGIRSDLSGWGYTSKPMSSSGNDFVYRF
jgi:hypothetical protein